MGRSLRNFVCVWLLLLLIGAATSAAGTDEGGDLAGEWVLKVGSRVLIVVTLTPHAATPGTFTGSLMRPKHFTSSLGGVFSDIQGPIVQYPVVKTSVVGKCLSFATQNPADKSDEDNYQLCARGQQQGTLKPDVPGFQPWPVSKEARRASVATDWQSRAYFLDDTDVSNPEMRAIFDADQKDRQGDLSKVDWSVVAKADADRREATRKLLADGKLHTGGDFERAAFVFQHGDKPDDYLLAHTLAVVAVSHGESSAVWIAAATLDRYLNSIHQPQIYGTQFFPKENGPTTQEPYNRELISDALRRQLGVPSLAAQEEQKKKYDKESRKK
jgi:hypothetical protein